MDIPMFNFNPDSGWTLELELECFVIYKELEFSGFPRGLQTALCDALASRSTLDSGTLKAKVGNFKSVFGHTGPTNASTATKFIAKGYGNMTLPETKALLSGYQLACAQILQFKTR